MKNFTNNFKQFTSRLSARWLIMALMMLVGTSSAWGDTYLAGDFNSWSSSNNKFSFSGNNGTLSITLNAKSTYNFKIVQDGTWRTNSNAGTMKRDNCTGWDFNTTGGNDNNTKIVTDIEGTYIFKYNKSTHTLSITYPNIDKVFIKGGMNNWGSDECTSEGDGIFRKSYSSNNNTEFKFVANNGSNWDGEGLYNTMSVDETKNTSALKLTRSDNSNTKITNTAGTAFDIVINTQTGKYWIEAPSCAAPQKPTININGLTGTVSTCNTNGTLTIDANHVAESYKLFTKSESTYTDKGTITNKSKTIETSGTYVVRAYNGDCMTESDAITFTKNPLPTISASTSTPESQTICENSSTTLSVKENMTSYLWSTEETTQSISVSKAGTYTVVAENSNGCKSNTLTFTITVNARPSAPSLSNPESICYGTPFTLPEKDNNKKTITWNVNNRELTNLSVGTHTYTAKIVENGCESTTVDYTITVKEQLAKPDLVVTNVKQCGSNYTAGKIVISNHDPNNTYILKKDGNIIDKTYNNGYSLSENEIGTYTVEVSKDGACGATSDANIEVTNNTPTVTPFEITKQANVCMGNPVTLSYDGTAQSGTISYAWYEGDSDVVLGTEETLTIQQAKNASYKLVVTVTSNDCSASPAEATTTVEPKAVPSAPTFDNDAMDACVNQQFTLPTPNNLNNGEEALWTVGGLPTSANQTLNEVDTYTYTAYKNDGCPSQGTPFTVRVNPKPTINIGEDVTAVKFEDVVLTATGNNIADVTWTADKGTITKDATDPTKAVLTYDQADAVIVTATATSAAGCTSVAATKTVTFSAEDCNSTTTQTEDEKTIEIWCRMSDNSNGSSIQCYGFGAGNFFGSYPGSKANNGTGTYNSKTYQKWKYTFDSKKSGLKVIFNTQGDNDKTGDISVGSSGKRYYYWYNKSSKTYGLDASETIYTTTTTPAQITAPAVKMLSAYSEEGSGELSMTAQIVKTGCNGNMTYYFKYRLKGDQAWSQTTPQTATGLKAGDEINETVSGLDQGGTYEIQAVINNNNEAVSNIIEYVVNIEETAISDVTLQFADGDGNVLPNQSQKYCVGSTAYIKLSYDGTAHKSLEWIAENELQPVNGEDKLYSYVVRGNETITANVANDENKGTPATGTIDINVYTIATTPDISIDRTEVCSTDPVGAKITVNAPQIGITYQAYKKVGDVETTHGDEVEVEDNAESIVINSIKETGTYYVKAWNAQCPDAIAVSLSKFAVTKIDASSNTIAISPVSASTNPWVPVTVVVDKNSAYDYTLVCKQDETDVTDQMVINKKGDSYVIKFPKPESAVIDKDGQVVFNDITYNVVVTLNGDVQCGTTSATSTVTLTNLIEDCD